MEQLLLNFDVAERKIYRVSELVGEVRRELEGEFRDIWIQGEISNLKKPPSGHWYFVLKDKDAQIAAVFFRLHNRLLQFDPEDGMDVLVRGSVTVYPPRGQLQVMVETMEPLGRGALQLAFEQLKARLQAEGLFDSAHKKKLPLLPRRIGVVTSPTGAAVQDILRVLKRRNDRIDVLIYPTRVQGKGAAEEIAAGIDYLNSRDDIDVLIVGRGGGSLEDLWAFNEEAVARAIFRSRIPVISAVGHEIDFTIADFVADLRAPTPSAAAEIVSAHREELLHRVEQLTRRAVQGIRYILQGWRQKLERLRHSRGFVDAETRVRFQLQRLDEARLRLSAAMGPLLDKTRRRVREDWNSLVRATQLYLSDVSARVRQAQGKLEAYSPLQVLQRGYAIVTNQAGMVVRSPDQLRPKELMHVRVQGGVFGARKEG
ncbi:MAG TPA: exodeoxyribonuclease VII large subunit [Acidobacteriota bacterium]|jgi:exodeoxyribonuclease VII large subunit|nr:exodeoxyribonuclease VII large subunit [Acidobacteriota bacterium]HRR56434.1 exodeoxyribonuclease VII large subunit [Acidobacteriota bacterium]HRV07333.1 exodeoxyribonuclease VII large subunit [Acidobacteriota bacterium]